MGWFSWFRKKEEPEYEQVLSNLSLEIGKKQSRLSEIRLRERRAALLVTMYAFAGWILYVAVWWAFLRHRLFWPQRYATSEQILKATPTLVGPIIVLFVRRIVQIWYAKKGDAEEKTLKALLVEQRTKIEEIKKKTNYYATRSLLERYDEGPVRKDPNTPNNLRRRDVKDPTGGPQTPILKLSPAPGSANRNGQTQPQGSGTHTERAENVRPPPASALLAPASFGTPLAPPQKHWYDKVADALLGDDAAGSPADKMKYALICENCFSHNGLCREEEWDDMKYVCPKCNYFNPSARQKRGEDQSYSYSRAQSILGRSAPNTVPNTAFLHNIPPEYGVTPPSAGLPAGNRSGTASPIRTGFQSSSPLRQSHGMSPSPSSSPSPSAKEGDAPRGRSTAPKLPPAALGGGEDEVSNDSAMDVDGAD